MGEWHTLDYDGGIVLRFNLIGIHPDGSRGKNFFEWLVDGFRANEDITLPVCRRLHRQIVVE